MERHASYPSSSCRLPQSLAHSILPATRRAIHSRHCLTFCLFLFINNNKSHRHAPPSTNSSIATQPPSSGHTAPSIPTRSPLHPASHTRPPAFRPLRTAFHLVPSRQRPGRSHHARYLSLFFLSISLVHSIDSYHPRARKMDNRPHISHPYPVSASSGAARPTHSPSAGYDDGQLGGARNDYGNPNFVPTPPSPEAGANKLSPLAGTEGYPDWWTMEDEEAERQYLQQGMFNWKEMGSWRFWFRKEWWCESRSSVAGRVALVVAASTSAASCAQRICRACADCLRRLVPRVHRHLCPCHPHGALP